MDVWSDLNLLRGTSSISTGNHFAGLALDVSVQKGEKLEKFCVQEYGFDGNKATAVVEATAENGILSFLETSWVDVSKRMQGVGYLVEC